MANPLQIVSKSAYLDEKAKAIFQTLLAEYQQGKIKSRTELAYRIYRALMDFYRQIGKPSFQVREVGGPPVSADFNAMMKEIQQDLSTLFAEAKLMSGAVQESFQYVETERQSLLDQVKRLTDRLQELKDAAVLDADSLTFHESFVDQSKLDQEMIEGTPVNINQTAGAMTLGLLDAVEVGEGVIISITPLSNGFPGNTHQVKTTDGILRFVGEEHMHLDLQALLDGNADTWFEYEAITVTPTVIEGTGGLGFTYQEGVSWLKTDEEPLRLQLQLELDKARSLNWLTLSPFLPAEKGAGPAKLVSILIEDGKGAKQIIQDGQSLSEDRVILLPQMKVKRLTLTFEQNTAYDIQAGHWFFTELERAATTIFEGSRQQSGKRVDGTKPSLEDLGLRYDPATQTVEMPSVKAEDTVPDRTEAASRLFSIPESGERIQAGIEAVPARRYAIGLKDIGLASYRFDVISTYVSTPFKTSRPIRRITLESSEEIPVEFGDGNWVTYYITIDGGQTWHEILPQDSLKQTGNLEYLIGTRIPAAGRRLRVGYLESQEPVTEVRVKVVLKRPETSVLKDADYYTPTVYDYRLHVDLEGVDEQ